MNDNLARLIADGFFSGMKEIPIEMEKFHRATLVVKAYRKDSIHVGGEEAELLSLHCAMLVNYESWPHDRTTYSMQPLHVNQKGKPFRWLEFANNVDDAVCDKSRVKTLAEIERIGGLLDELETIIGKSEKKRY